MTKPPIHPLPETWSDTFVHYVVLPAVLFAACFGWLGLFFVAWMSLDLWRDRDSPSMREQRSLPSMAATPLRSLVQASRLVPAAGTPPFQDGELVRVEGFLQGEPPIASLKFPDQLYAWQSLTVTHQESRFEGETQWPADQYTDDEREYTPPLWLDAGPSGADAGRVEVRLPAGWSGIICRAFISVGKVDPPGAIPEDVARGLAMPSVAPKPGQEWLLWAIPQNRRVTVLALARWREGRVVLELVKDHHCVISPQAWENIAIAPLTVWEIAKMAGFCAFFALLPVPWYFWRRWKSRQVYGVPSFTGVEN